LCRRCIFLQLDEITQFQNLRSYENQGLAYMKWLQRRKSDSRNSAVVPSTGKHATGGKTETRRSGAEIESMNINDLSAILTEMVLKQYRAKQALDRTCRHDEGLPSSMCC
jgi:hypothetical protein